MLSTQEWLVPEVPDSITLQWGSHVDASSHEGWTGGANNIVKAKSSGEDPRATEGLVSNVPHPRVNKTKQHCCRVRALPPSCAEFRRSHQKEKESTLRWWWPVFICHIHLCWVVSINRHTGFYAQPRAQTHGLDLADLVEAGSCNTSQHRWQSLNDDWAF